MKNATTARILVVGLALLMMVANAAANDPIFVKWLVMDDPGDETIRYYWERAEAEELGPEELVDLGTMLFYRGWSKDAVTYFREALDADPELAEAWFRIGLIKHHDDDISGARSAYEKCLKIRSGHGWANFYLGLLEEQSGNSKTAMEHFEKAFEHAPGLADPRLNPEILSSKLQLGAQVHHYDRERFEDFSPMPYLEPASVRKVRRTFEPTPVLTPTPTPIIGPRAMPTPTPAPNRAATARKRKATATGGTAAGKTGGTSAGSSTTRRGSGTTNAVPDADNTPFGFQPPPSGNGTGATGTGTGGTATPEIGSTSPEASLGPAWPALYRIAGLFI